MEDPQGGVRAPRSHTSADSAARESSYGSARTGESDARREAWARHPYYSSQEEQQQQQHQQYAAPPLAEEKSSRSKRGSRKGHHRSSKSSKHGSSAISASGGSGEVGVGSGLIPTDKQQLQMQIEQNRDALMRQKELLKKQEAARAYRAMRENTAAAPSLAALLMVCIWISLVSGFSILAFGWIFNVFVQATPFFYVSLGTGSSLVLLGSFLAAFRSKTPSSVAFGA
ncbi:uncharacterized protein [Dermacentor andersoni]|uniref:uncharacterized protein n=1 Tax=Dermacentor andersoni TaxID=34620 RepID=UPI0021554F7B|nr:uncharacterized protein LOC126539529 [Dermacentor andersoni]